MSRDQVRDASVVSRDEVRDASVVRFDAKGRSERRDRIAHEEPLEIEVGSTPLAVLMRTPGHDIELGTGFLLTERIVPEPGWITSIHHASHGDAEGADNRLRVALREGHAIDLESLRRNLYASSSCGVCGKASREQALATAAPLDADGLRIDAAVLTTLPDRLRAGQAVFEETGGLHAAGLFGADGSLHVVREDVGRHNALDKVVGWAARSGRLPLSEQLLMVSGRASFEIVQKALAARIPVVAAVSAPSSLAVGLARDAGVTLVGFLRGGSFNVYAHPQRIGGGAKER